MTSEHHSIIGLPGSGKTTFLAAFWHLINAGEIRTRLVLDKLEGDHRYLDAIVDVWRRCEEIPHTSAAAEATVFIHVQERGSGRKAVLRFSDLSGESFELQFVTRSCPAAYVEGFQGDGGLLLFVTADRGQDGITIVELESALAGAGAAERQGEKREWSHGLAPVQVRLVDLLQFLQRPPFRRLRRRVAILVSAWDVVTTPAPSPEEWLCRELPLLHQFVSANAASFESRVYGVSAQGGTLTGSDRLDLLRLTPSERIRCNGPESELHDLTVPIAWLMAKA